MNDEPQNGGYEQPQVNLEKPASAQPQNPQPFQNPQQNGSCGQPQPGQPQPGQQMNGQYPPQQYQDNPQPPAPFQPMQLPGGGQYGQQPNGMAPTSNLAILSLVIGCVSVLCLCCFSKLALFPAGTAIVFGILSLQHKEPKRGLAIAGIATGSVACGLAILSIALIILAGSFAATDSFLNTLLRTSL